MENPLKNYTVWYEIKGWSGCRTFTMISNGSLADITAKAKQMATEHNGQAVWVYGNGVGMSL